MIALLQVPLSLGLSTDVPKLGSSLLGIVIGGAAVGGLLFGRLGPSAFARTSLPLTLLELGIAAAAVIGTSLAAVAIEPKIVGSESGTTAAILLTAALGLGSALLGAFLGHSIRQRTSSLLDALTFVAVTGGCYLLLFKTILVLSLVTETFAVVLTLVGSFVLPILGGVLTRYLMGERTVRVMLHGSILIAGLIALIILLEAYRKTYNQMSDAIAGTFAVAILGLVFFGLCCAGAAIAAKFGVRPWLAAFETGQPQAHGPTSTPKVAEARLVDE